MASASGSGVDQGAARGGQRLEEGEEGVEAQQGGKEVKVLKVDRMCPVWAIQKPSNNSILQYKLLLPLELL